MTDLGPYLINGGLSVDDRGCVSFVNDFNFQDVKRFYMVENHQRGFIRAFHYHKNEAKYVLVVNGTILLYAVHVDTDTANKFILSAKKPQILFIPKGYANGFKTLEENTKIMFFSTATLAESLNDDERLDFDLWHYVGVDWNEDYR